MNDANDSKTLHILKTELDTLITVLTTMLANDSKLKFVGYEMSPVLACDEAQVLSHGQQQIAVTQLSQWQHLWTVLNYYQRFLVADKCSTRFVSRMPGIIVSSLPATIVMSVVEQINAKKDQIKAVIQKGRNHQQRHQFIHQLFPQIMTEQLYRHIRFSQLPISRVWFRWETSRQVNKTYSNQDAIAWLEQQRHKPKGLFEATEWLAAINNAVEQIELGKYKYVQRERQYRVFPHCEYSYYLDDERKTGKFNPTSPWLLLEQPHNALPGGTPLKSFQRLTPLKKTQLKAKSQSIFKPLKLIGVFD